MRAWMNMMVDWKALLLEAADQILEDEVRRRAQNEWAEKFASVIALVIKSNQWFAWVAWILASVPRTARQAVANVLAEVVASNKLIHGPLGDAAGAAIRGFYSGAEAWLESDAATEAEIRRRLEGKWQDVLADDSYEYSVQMFRVSNERRVICIAGRPCNHGDCTDMPASAAVEQFGHIYSWCVDAFPMNNFADAVQAALGNNMELKSFMRLVGRNKRGHATGLILLLETFKSRDIDAEDPNNPFFTSLDGIAYRFSEALTHVIRTDPEALIAHLDENVNVEDVMNEPRRYALEILTLALAGYTPSWYASFMDTVDHLVSVPKVKQQLKAAWEGEGWSPLLSSLRNLIIGLLVLVGGPPALLFVFCAIGLAVTWGWSTWTLGSQALSLFDLMIDGGVTIRTAWPYLKMLALAVIGYYIGRLVFAPPVDGVESFVTRVISGPGGRESYVTQFLRERGWLPKPTSASAALALKVPQETRMRHMGKVVCLISTIAVEVICVAILSPAAMQPIMVIAAMALWAYIGTTEAFFQVGKFRLGPKWIREYTQNMLEGGGRVATVLAGVVVAMMLIGNGASALGIQIGNYGENRNVQRIHFDRFTGSKKTSSSNERSSSNGKKPAYCADFPELSDCK